MGLINAETDANYLEQMNKASEEIDRLLTDFERTLPESSLSELPTEDLPPTNDELERYDRMLEMRGRRYVRQG